VTDCHCCELLGRWFRYAGHTAGQSGRVARFGERVSEGLEKLRVLAGQPDRPRCHGGRAEV